MSQNGDITCCLFPKLSLSKKINYEFDPVTFWYLAPRKILLSFYVTSQKKMFVIEIERKYNYWLHYFHGKRKK
jgi:hypothetical protein